MKRIALFALLALTFGATSAQTFTLRGTVPGLKAGSEVVLAARHQGELARGVASDGSFTLTGSVDMPLLAELRINDGGDEGVGHAIDLMVENVPIEISAAHIDSIPPGFYFGGAGKLKEKNVTVKGGQAQQEYAEYAAAMFPYQYLEKVAHQYLWGNDSRRRPKADRQAASKAYDGAQMMTAAANDAFIKEHPLYAISSIKWLEALAQPFAFTSEELGDLSMTLGETPHPVYRQRLAEAIAKARKFTKGMHYADFEVLDVDKKPHKISSLIPEGKYAMVDFWASWCGPCRASIPHVRELWQKYGDRLEVFSVSVDAGEADWRKAMEQEKMEWTQLWDDESRLGPLREHFGLSTIPYMLLFSPDGKIVYAGHDANEVSETLAKELDSQL